MTPTAPIDAMLTFKVEMFPRGLGRWNFIVIYSDGVLMRSYRSLWGYQRTRYRAHECALEARRD
jgi:hypothetical protein